MVKFSRSDSELISEAQQQRLFILNVTTSIHPQRCIYIEGDLASFGHTHFHTSLSLSSLIGYGFLGLSPHTSEISVERNFTRPKFSKSEISGGRNFRIV